MLIKVLFGERELEFLHLKKSSYREVRKFLDTVDS